MGTASGGDDFPAFPVPSLPNEMGLTKRELYAVLLLQGVLSSVGGYTNRKSQEQQVRQALAYADILTEVLNE